MAPEQASGKKGMVTTASDVYGLGATLYALLTGRAPFGGRSLLETLDLVQETQPISPSKINPKVPRDLATICLKCMEKTPARRYETALQVAEDLANWRQRRPIKARPVGPIERLRLWCLRRPGLATALFSLVLVAALGVVGIAWRLRQEQRALASEARTNYFNRIALAAQAWSDSNFGRAAELIADCPPGLRGWEWYHLRGHRNRPLSEIKNAHADGVYSVSFSPNGEYLASGRGDGLVELWDLATGKSRTFGADEGHKARVRCVVFRPDDGLKLASASWDGTVKIWDVATGRLDRTLMGHKGRVISVAFSPNGKLLASAGYDGFVRIWDAMNHKQIPMILSHKSPILSVTYSPDGKLLASASDDGEVKFWDAATGRLVQKVSETIEGVRCVAFHEDSIHLALACGDGMVRVLDRRTGRIVSKTRGGHTDAVRGVAYGPGGTRIASASGDGTVKLWDVGDGQEPMQEAITLATSRNVVVRSVVFGPASESNYGQIAAAYEDGTIRLWDAPKAASPWAELWTFPGHQGVVHGVAYSPDMRYIATACGDQSIRICDTGTHRETILPSGHIGPVYAVAYDRDNRYLASAGADKVVRLFETATKQLIRELPGHTDDVWCLAFSRDGSQLASADGNGMVNLWNVASGVRKKSHPLDKGVWCLAFSPDGRTLAVGADNGFIEVLDIEAEWSAPGQRWQAHDGGVFGLSFSPSGSRLASSGEDGRVKLWDPKAHVAGLSFNGLDRSDSVAFSPDGRYLVATSGDGTIKVFDAESDLTEPLLLHGHTSRVLCLAFSRDGKRLVSAGFDGRPRVWDTTAWPTPLGH
jgi:WD40 repeat protein